MAHGLGLLIQELQCEVALRLLGVSRPRGSSRTIAGGLGHRGHPRSTNLCAVGGFRSCVQVLALLLLLLTEMSCAAPGRSRASPHPSPSGCTMLAVAGPVDAASAQRCGLTLGSMLYGVDCRSTNSLPSYMRAETQSRSSGQRAIPAVLPISGGACAMESPAPDTVFRLRGAAVSSADLLEIADFSTNAGEASYTSISVRCTDRQCLSVGVDTDGTLSILEITGAGQKTLTSAGINMAAGRANRMVLQVNNQTVRVWFNGRSVGPEQTATTAAPGYSEVFVASRGAGPAGIRLALFQVFESR